MFRPVLAPITFSTVMALLITTTGPALAQHTVALAGTSAGLFLSRDRGITWEKVAALGDTPVRTVSIDRVDPRRLYVITPDALLTSADGGLTWSPLGLGNPAQIQRFVADSAALFALVDRVIWSSADGGATWRPDESAPGAVYDISLDADGDRLYAISNFGVSSRTVAGPWESLPAPSDAERILADPETPGAVTLMGNSAWAVTFDRGNTWTELPRITNAQAMAAIGAPFPESDTVVTTRFLDLAPGDRAGAPAGLLEICTTWDGSFIGCGAGVVFMRNGEWRGIAVNGAVDTRLAVDRASDLALTGGFPWRSRTDGPSGLHRSLDLGVSWTAVAGFEQATVTALAIHTEPLKPLRRDLPRPVRHR